MQTAAMPKVTSIRLSDDLIARLDQLAASLNHPRAWVIEEAIIRYIDEEGQQAAAIEDALLRYQRGGAKVTLHAEVMNGLRDQISAT